MNPGSGIRNLEEEKILRSQSHYHRGRENMKVEVLPYLYGGVGLTA